MPRQTRLSYKAVVAIAFVLGLFMDILDTTIVNVALPALSRDFDASTNTISWVVTGYLLSLALWIPASGWLGDRFGTKRVFVFALAMFTVASALCGLAWSLESLVAFRVLQGVGGGMLAPVGTAMLYRAYPPEERPRASSILSMVTVLAPAIGPVLGGLLVEKASWHWIFLVNVPIGIAGVIFSVLYLEEHREPSARSFDVWGFLLAGAGLAALLYGLAEGPSRGWGDGIVVVSLALGGVLAVVLVVVELRLPNPMLDLRLFAQRSFRMPNVVSFTSFGALIGTLFLLPQYLQGPRGLSPLESGLTTFPQAFGVLIMARIVGGKLYPIIGPRRLAAFGALGVAAVTSLFSFVGLETSPWWIRLLMFSRGLFMGFIFIPVQAAAFARIPLPSTGRASALFQVQRQIGAAVGVAVLATVYVERLVAYDVPTQPGAALTAAAADGWTKAFHQSILVAAGLGLIAFLAALLIKDEDAAPTMKPRQPKAAAAPAAAS